MKSDHEVAVCIHTDATLYGIENVLASSLRRISHGQWNGDMAARAIMGALIRVHDHLSTGPMRYEGLGSELEPSELEQVNGSVINPPGPSGKSILSQSTPPVKPPSEGTDQLHCHWDGEQGAPFDEPLGRDRR